MLVALFIFFGAAIVLGIIYTMTIELAFHYSVIIGVGYTVLSILVIDSVTLAADQRSEKGGYPLLIFVSVVLFVTTAVLSKTYLRQPLIELFT